VGSEAGWWSRGECAAPADPDTPPARRPSARSTPGRDSRQRGCTAAGREARGVAMQICYADGRKKAALRPFASKRIASKRKMRLPTEPRSDGARELRARRLGWGEGGAKYEAAARARGREALRKRGSWAGWCRERVRRLPREWCSSGGRSQPGPSCSVPPAVASPAQGGRG
jgi:hypothetical protein